MSAIRMGEAPPGALTQRYKDAGAYVDCFWAPLSRPVTLAEFVSAFYTTWLFRLERWILRFAAARPSTDDEAHELARGERDSFAAWTVEARARDQLLVRDFTGRTCSWFMVAPTAGMPGTRLYFGSVVIPVRDSRTGAASLGPVHGRLIGFHRVYSRLLLRAAARRL
jgi:hypothetical protein